MSDKTPSEIYATIRNEVSDYCRIVNGDDFGESIIEALLMQIAILHHKINELEKKHG